MVTMKLREKMAFITAMALFAGTQAAFVSAAEEEVTENGGKFRRFSL